MDDLLSEFLTETTESLDSLDNDLIKLEENPNDPDLLSNIFRLVHTIKGTCGFLGLPRLEAVAHSGENVLGKIRDGELEVSEQAISIVLEALDQIKEILGILEATESEPEGDDTDLITRLNAMASGEAAPPPAEAPPAESTEPPAEEPAAEEAPAEGDIHKDAGAAAAAEAMAAAAQAEGAAATADALGSLYDQLEGEEAITKTVAGFYSKVLADDSLKGFFENVDPDVQQGKMVKFLSKVLGGPDNYDGKDLATAHAPLVAKGLNEDHFNAVATHFQEALVENGAWGPTVEEVMAVVATTKDDVLGQSEAGKAAVAALGAEAPVDEAPAAEAAVPAPAEQPQAKAVEKKAETAKQEGGKESSVATSSIRVTVDLLEDLMTMVSEMVLTRNQLMQILRQQDDSEFAAPLERLNLITSELQEGVMKTRMQPIGNAWAKLPRIVRDLSHELGKKIDLEMLGAETELDRQVLELIKDPLTHMVRNSGDHGVEDPATRLAAGKPETGTITLNAYHEGGHIIIEIKDDGAGLSVERIRAKALEKGMATEAELEEMSDHKIQSFVMGAGFSTAAKVTSVSGRGVGMDVVRTNVEKIGGTVELKSTEGKGTLFTVKIPLTLAIVSALIVECAGDRFAIPQISVLELVRTSSQSETTIEMINEAPVLRLRDRLLPLVSLRDLMGLEDDEEEEEEGAVAALLAGPSLFERIGGEAAVNAAVDLFYEKVLSDVHLKEFFENVNLDVLKERQKQFFVMVLGGPDGYEGADLATAHAPLVARGLDDVHFDAVAAHLTETLMELGVEEELSQEVLSLVDSTRDQILGRAEAPAAGETAEETSDEENDETFIVVSQVGNYTFGIIVDKVFDTEEIVVKPVSPILRDIALFSGNTILGDGSVIMILDPNGIAAATGETGVSDEDAEQKGMAVSDTAGEKTSLLLFHAGDESPKAVPLALIARLEEIELDKVEITHGMPMVQYRGHLMPLVPISEEQDMKTEGRQPVLVFSDREHSMGLVVDEIVDIVEEVTNMELAAERPGILGSAIISGQATNMIDAGYYLTQAFPDWFGAIDGDSEGVAPGRHVLLVDDSPFFRNLLTPLLSVAGYRVTTADSPAQALEYRDQGRDFDIIISDIEMPEMNGFEFAENVKQDSRWQKIPMVALSSRTSQEDIDRGREVGFADYVAKTDRDGLLETLSETINT